MVARRNLYWYISSLLWACLLTWHACVFAQTPQQKSDDVVRVFTELVQTDVMVFDKQGHFVNGLTKDNFEIKIDGQVSPIQFFEKISAGSHNEESQLAAARGSIAAAGVTPVRVVQLERGRSIFLYVDDYHLEPQGFVSCRKLMSDFIDKDIGQNDRRHCIRDRTDWFSSTSNR